MARVLKPRGLLLLSFHIGEETVHRDEWMGAARTHGFPVLFSRLAIQSDLEAAGLDRSKKSWSGSHMRLKWSTSVEERISSPASQRRRLDIEPV